LFKKALTDINQGPYEMQGIPIWAVSVMYLIL